MYLKNLKNNKKNVWTYGSRATQLAVTRVMLIDDNVLTFTNECLNYNNNDNVRCFYCVLNNAENLRRSDDSIDDLDKDRRLPLHLRETLSSEWVLSTRLFYGSYNNREIIFYVWNC